MAAHDPTDPLPVSVANARPYLRLRPTADGLDPETVTSHLQRLHRLTRQPDSEGFLTRLQGQRPPTREVTLRPSTIRLIASSM